MNCRRRQRTDVTHITAIHRGPAQYKGALATAVGIGAALSTSFGGKLIQSYSFRASFLALGGVAAIAFCLLWFGIPETLGKPTEPEMDSLSPPAPQEASP